MPNWQKVKLADECEKCNDCGEPWCKDHSLHYFECSCAGPSQDDEYHYLEKNGILYARPKENKVECYGKAASQN